MTKSDFAAKYFFLFSTTAAPLKTESRPRPFKRRADVSNRQTARASPVYSSKLSVLFRFLYTSQCAAVY